ncbi:hypothetical protein [Caulobacter sp. UNC358MFTsu5.1]|uniref:hypothetical protein n=1 Tax=Caulobacter sp. UNC358MFTsu5.1 TaxID=1449049 RepID=UPI0012DFA87D|nr:hypothetical protein [Caulobacter sp. UNC358MFTsu5.1]
MDLSVRGRRQFAGEYPQKAIQFGTLWSARGGKEALHAVDHDEPPLGGGPILVLPDRPTRAAVRAVSAPRLDNLGEKVGDRFQIEREAGVDQ